MLAKPAGRWFSRSLFTEPSDSKTLFFSRAARPPGRHPKVSGRVPSQVRHVSGLVQRREFFHNAAVEPSTDLKASPRVTKKRGVTRAGDPPTKRQIHSTSLKANQAAEGRRSGSHGRLDSNVLQGSKLALLSSLEHSLLGSSHIARREALKYWLRNASISDSEIGHSRPLTRYTREQNFLRHWGLENVAKEYKYGVPLSKGILGHKPAQNDVPEWTLRIPSREFCRNFVGALKDLLEEEKGAISQRVLCAGLFAAARLASTSWMRYFLSNLRGVEASQLQDTLTAINIWLRRNLPHADATSYQRDELHEILVGCPINHQNGAQDPAQPSILDVANDWRKLALTTEFLSCITAVGASEALTSVWKRHFEALAGTTDVAADEEDAQKLTEAFIICFLRSRPAAPSEAWSLAMSSLRAGRPLHNDVIERLMRWPEFITETTQLPQYMLEHLKKGLEDWAQRIESGLGVAWDPSTKAHMPLNKDVAELLERKDELLSEALAVENKVSKSEVSNSSVTKEMQQRV